MNSLLSQNNRRLKIQVTHASNISRNNSLSKQRIGIKTPPRFRILNTERSESNRLKSQTFEKVCNQNNQQKQTLINTSSKRKYQQLLIDTDIFNQKYQAKQSKKLPKTFFHNSKFHSDDSSTIPSKIQMKRKQGLKNLENTVIDKGINNYHENKKVILNPQNDDMSDDSKIHTNYSRISIEKDNRSTKVYQLMKNMSQLKNAAQRLKLDIGHDFKINEIIRLTKQLQSQMMFHKETDLSPNNYSRDEYSFKIQNGPEQNQIQIYFTKVCRNFEQFYESKDLSKQKENLIEFKTNRNNRVRNYGVENQQSILNILGTFTSRSGLTKKEKRDQSIFNKR